eukprot:1507957-Pyramimonas_sp.AAC.1
MASPISCTPSPIVQQEWQWHVFPRHGFLEGIICVDGSAIDPGLPWCTRAGWAAVSLYRQGTILGSLYGPLPHPLQSNLGG